MKSRSTGKRKIEITSGSPQSGEPVYLTIGWLRRPHGLGGEVLSELTPEHLEIVKAGCHVFVGKSLIPCSVDGVRQADKLWLLHFEGYDDSESVVGFRNMEIHIDVKDAAPLAEGQFYHHEIIGMRAFDEKNEFLGTVEEIIVTGANDVYVIRREIGDDVLVPAIKSVVIHMDRDSRSMIVRPQEWL